MTASEVKKQVLWFDDGKRPNVADELAKDVINENFASFGDAHECSRGHGYMGGTCPAALRQGPPSS